MWKELITVIPTGSSPNVPGQYQFLLHPRFLLRPAFLHYLFLSHWFPIPNITSLHSNNFQSTISRYLTRTLYSGIKTSLPPQVTCLIYLLTLAEYRHPMTTNVWTFKADVSVHLENENLLKTQWHIWVYCMKILFPFLIHWGGKVSNVDISPLNKTWQVSH